MATRKWMQALVVALALALFAWRELAAMRVDGVTFDEPLHLGYGERGLLQGTFERDVETLNSKMPVSVLNALPVVVAARLGGPPDRARRLWLARLPTVALGMLLGGLVCAWAWELFGFGGGVLALALFTCCPNFLAHSHLVTTDVATALAMFGATYAFWHYRRRPGGWRLAVAATAFGVAQLTKATALFLAPIFVLIVVVEWLRVRAAAPAAPAASQGRLAEGAPAEAAPKAPIAAIAPIAGIALISAMAGAALLILNLGFAGERTLTPLSRYELVSPQLRALAAVPVLRDIPIPLPVPYVQGLDMVAHDAHADAWSYLHGRFSGRGFWNYYLVAFLIKVPVGTLGLLALAAWLAATGRVRAGDAEAFLIVPVVFLLAYLSFGLALQIGLRYMLPAFPFLFVFAARAAAWRPLASPRGALVGGLAAWTVGSSLYFHPHYIPYFNELIGGPRNGYRWLGDSNVDWGQDNAYMTEVYARRSPVRLWIEPGGPIAGRVAVSLFTLLPRHAWLRDHFRPTALVHNSWALFDVSPADLERCCADVPHAWTVPDAEGDLAPAGRAIGGGEGIGVRLLDKLNDGMLGANSEWDAARSSPGSLPVKAWFGIAWDSPQEIGRAVIYPGFYSRGPGSRRYLARDYVLQQWDGQRWIDLPGTRVQDNRRLHVEHSFPPVRTTRLRLYVERQLNQDGSSKVPGVFRAACLEIAVYRR